MLYGAGFDCAGFPFTFILVFVRAEFEIVREMLSPFFKPPPNGPQYGMETIVFQFHQHSWTGFLSDDSILDIVPQWSREFKSPFVVIHHEDTSGWTSYRAFENGEIVEELEFGFAGDVVDYENSAHASTFDIVNSNGDGNYSLYRSSARAVTSDDIQDTTDFLDKRFTQLGLWCPDWDTIPKIEQYDDVQMLATTLYRRKNSP